MQNIFFHLILLGHKSQVWSKRIELSIQKKIHICSNNEIEEKIPWYVSVDEEYQKTTFTISSVWKPTCIDEIKVFQMHYGTNYQYAHTKYTRSILTKWWLFLSHC